MRKSHVARIHKTAMVRHDFAWIASEEDLELAESTTANSSRLPPADAETVSPDLPTTGGAVAFDLSTVLQTARMTAAGDNLRTLKTRT